VDTPDGKATIVEVFITELGNLMAKLYYPSTKQFVNQKIGNIDDLTKASNIHLLSPVTKKIFFKKSKNIE